MKKTWKLAVCPATWNWDGTVQPGTKKSCLKIVKSELSTVNLWILAANTTRTKMRYLKLICIVSDVQRWQPDLRKKFEDEFMGPVVKVSET